MIYLFLLIMLLASPAYAATRYVDNGSTGGCVNGSTTYNPATRACGGGSSTVHVTFRAGLDALPEGGGNTLYVRQGTYNENFVYGNLSNEGFGGGATSWGSATVISNYPGEAVTIQRLQINIDGGSGYGAKYIIFQGDNRANFVFDGLAPSGGGSGLRVNGAVDHIRFTKLTVKGHTFGIQGGTSSGCASKPTVIEIIDNLVTLNGFDTNQNHGIYPACSDQWFIDHNDIINNYSYGIHFNNPITNAHTNDIITNNYIEGRQETYTGSNSATACILYNYGSNVTIAYNVCNGQGLSAGKQSVGIQIDHVTTGLIYKNTVYDTAGSSIQIATGTSIVVKDNILNTSGSNDMFEIYTSSSLSGSGNVCHVSDSDISSACGTINATPGFVAAGSGDFRLTSSSVAINAGVTHSGYPYNGSNPDAGAFETFNGSSGTVSGNVLQAQLGMNLNTPIIPGSTGWTVNNGRNVTAVAVAGSSAVNLTFDGAACSTGQTWTWSYSTSTGTATDSALVGGRLNQQLYNQSGISTVNNCSGAGYTITQTTGAFYDALGAQATTRQQFGVKAGGIIAIRTKMKFEGGNPPELATKLQYAFTENGTYTDVPDTFSADNIRYVGQGTTFPGMDSHGSAVSTERLTSSFSGMIAGAVIRCGPGCSIPAIDPVQDSENEMVDIIEFDTDAVVGTQYWFRRVLQDGTSLNYNAQSKPLLVIERPGSTF